MRARGARPGSGPLEARDRGRARVRTAQQPESCTMCVSVVGVPAVARLSPLACVTARGKCFARVYEIKPDGLPLKSRIFPSRPLTAARVRAAVFVRSEKSNALVGDGVLQPAPRSANLDSAFGGMQLFATEAGEQLLCCSHALHSWHSLLCGCHSCDSDGLALTGPQSLVLRLV